MKIILLIFIKVEFKVFIYFVFYINKLTKFNADRMNIYFFISNKRTFIKNYISN